MHRGDSSKQKVEATPPVKVVGFHVEGASPSPRSSVLSQTLNPSGASLSPVIIPPSFQAPQGSTTHQRTPGTAADAPGDVSPHGAMSAASATGTAQPGGTPLRPLRTVSDNDVMALPVTPGRRSATLPLTPVAAGAVVSSVSPGTGTVPSVSPLQGPAQPVKQHSAPPAAMGTSSAVQPAGGPGSAKADRRSVSFNGSDGAASVGTTQPPLTKQPSNLGRSSTPTPSPRPAQQQESSGASGATAGPQQQASQKQAAAQSGPQAAHGAPRQKEMTKAERRALQEAQRAAKAAGKNGGQGGGKAGSQGGGGKAGSGPGAAGGRLVKAGSRESLAGSERGSLVTGSLFRDRTVSREERDASGVGTPGPGGSPLLAGGAGGSSSASGTGGSGTTGAATGGSNPRQQAAQQAAQQQAQQHQAHHAARSTELFAHLPPFRPVTVDAIVERGAASGVPLCAVRLGMRLTEGSLRGANARCIAMLSVFREVISGFRTAGGRDLARELSPVLNGVIAFLVACRPLSISMGAAIKHVKAAVEKLKLEPGVPESEAKERLLAVIQSFVQEKILFAGDVVARQAASRLKDDDVVLTYGYSSLVAAVLGRAAATGTRFSVVVADARPLHEGRRLLPMLAAAGVPTQYVSLNGLGFVLPRVTKVLLGAGGVLSNGAVIARAGTAAVGMAAAAAHVPVLVACETYKFHDRVQLDSITHNELGDPDLLVKTPAPAPQCFKDWRQQEGLGLLSLMYDTMPARCVSMVVTEVGAIPPTSVPVILREYRVDGAAA